MSNTKVKRKVEKAIINVAQMFRHFDADDVNHHLVVSKGSSQGVSSHVSNCLQKLAREGYLERVENAEKPTRLKNCRSGNMRAVWKKA